MTILKLALMLTIMFTLIACAKPKDGKDGIDGVAGISGPKGDQGVDGHDGETGPQGPAGADGLPAQVVSLCPGVNTYPGVFVEVALCLNNRLYGVYSANGGFLTELPPGSYSSNAIGSACNLTIQQNCVVSH